jgi:hypothetical protein
LDGSREIQSQIQHINLPGSVLSEFDSIGVSPYGILHFVVGPYFNAYINEKGVISEGCM